jgi:hypothetical protein
LCGCESILLKFHIIKVNELKITNSFLDTEKFISILGAAEEYNPLCIAGFEVLRR